MFLSSATPIYGAVDSAAEGWPMAIILTFTLLTAFSVALFKYKLKGVIMGVICILICVGMVAFGFSAYNDPKNTAKGKFEASAAIATASIKSEAMKQNGVEILNDNVFELNTVPSRYGVKYKSKLKEIIQVKNASGEIQFASLVFNNDRTKITLAAPSL